ncbi:MAG TPA: amino acid permease, partial [Pseudoduganella sp.]
VTGGSPFVLIFHALNSNVIATVLNVVVLTAALSVYNSGVYSNSRMLFGLARQGNAPKFLLTVNKRGVPLAALGVSAFATGICVVVNYIIPGKAFEVLMGLVVSSLIINWGMISWIHLRFRAQKKIEGKVTAFQSLGYPLTNYLCLVFLAGILVVMYLTPELRISVYLIPVWLLALWIGYRSKRNNGAVGNGAATVGQ